MGTCDATSMFFLPNIYIPTGRDVASVCNTYIFVSNHFSAINKKLSRPNLYFKPVSVVILSLINLFTLLAQVSEKLLLRSVFSCVHKQTNGHLHF